MDDELTHELIDELRATRRALRELQHGDLVARLTEAERNAIAQQILDRLDDRLSAKRDTPTDTPPRPRKRGRSIRDYFDG